MTDLNFGYLAGAGEYRSVLGSGPQRRYRIGLVIGVCVLIVGTLINMVWGLIIGLAVIGVLALLLNPSTSGDLLAKMVSRVRWQRRRSLGINRFIPYTQDAWEAAAQLGGRKRRRARRALRSLPDGAAGMGWLVSERGRSGVAWHYTPHGEQYLSVAFEVEGRMKGFESNGTLNYASARFGAFLAAKGSDFALARYVQTMTRVLPPDAVHHEAWAAEAIDTDLASRDQLGAELVGSYRDVLAAAAAIGTVQRHFVIVRYDIDAAFRSSAARYGKGVNAMRELMDVEVAALTRDLAGAGLGRVRPLTARQVAALIRHSQCPSFEIDRVSDLEPMGFGIASRDTRTMTVTSDELLQVEWFTATARIEAPNLDATTRTVFWLHGLVTNLQEPVVRTVAFHQRIIPVRIARQRARNDLVMDGAELAAKRKKGSIATEEVEALEGAAAQRNADLTPGSGHHGTEWIGFITVTATSQKELAFHTRLIAERAANELGVQRLVWCRDAQSTAAGATWPIARGLHAHRGAGVGAKLEGAIARVDEGEL